MADGFTYQGLYYPNPGNYPIPAGAIPANSGSYGTVAQPVATGAPLLGASQGGGVGSTVELINTVCNAFPNACRAVGSVIPGIGGLGGSPPIVEQPGVIPNIGTMQVQAYACPPQTVVRPDGSIRTIRMKLNRAGQCVPAKRPSMNVLNPKALLRAGRRLGGFQKFAKKADKLINKQLRGAGARVTKRGCGTCGKSKCGCK